MTAAIQQQLSQYAARPVVQQAQFVDLNALDQALGG